MTIPHAIIDNSIGFDTWRVQPVIAADAVARSVAQLLNGTTNGVPGFRQLVPC